MKIWDSVCDALKCYKRICARGSDLDVALGRSADEAALGGVDGQRFDGRVVSLETLALDLQTEVQNTDPAPPAPAEQQLLFRRQSQNRGAGLVTAEACSTRLFRCASRGGGGCVCV